MRPESRAYPDEPFVAVADFSVGLNAATMRSIPQHAFGLFTLSTDESCKAIDAADDRRGMPEVKKIGLQIESAEVARKALASTRTGQYKVQKI
jgi:hypothetical protein